MYHNPFTAIGFSAMFIPFSWNTLRDEHYRHPIAVVGVVDTFRLILSLVIQYLRKWAMKSHFKFKGYISFSSMSQETRSNEF